MPMTTATATAPAPSEMTAAQPAKKEAQKTKPLPGPNSDFYQLTDLLTAEEKAIVKKVRAYMETKVAPIINKYWSDDAFPFELLPSFKELGLGGQEVGELVEVAVRRRKRLRLLSFLLCWLCRWHF